MRRGTACLVIGGVMVFGALGWSASAFAEKQAFNPGGGAEQFFEVPAGVTQVKVTAVGATGEAGCTSGPGGVGAKATAALAVTSGEKLYVDFMGGQAPPTNELGCVARGGVGGERL